MPELPWMLFFQRRSRAEPWRAHVKGTRGEVEDPRFADAARRLRAALGFRSAGALPLARRLDS